MKTLVDALFIPVIIAVLIIGIIISIFLFNTLSSAFYNATNLQVFANTKTIENSLVYLIIAIYFALPVASIFLAVLYGSEPVFAILSLALLVINVFLSAIMKDVIVSFVNALSYLNAVKENYIISILIEYYPFIMFIFGLMIIASQFIFKQQIE